MKPFPHLTPPAAPPAREPAAAQPPLADPASEAVCPLSFAQQRLWFLNQIEPDLPAYHIVRALRIQGELDASALRQAFQEITRRHGSLRTTFATQSNQAVQVVHRQINLALPVADLSSFPPEQREAEARRLALEEFHKPFNLETGPLFRVHLIRLGPSAHLLLIAMHHIISDGWSVSVLARELKALYSAVRLGQPAALPAPALQYAAFAQQQRQRLQGENLERQLSYWRQQLDGCPAELALPADWPRPSVQSYAGARLPFAF